MNKKLTIAIISLVPVFTAGAQSDFDVDQFREDIALVGNTDYEGETSDATDLKTGYIPFDYHNTVTGNSPWRKTPRGMLVIGTGDTLRAIDRFSGSATAARGYADAVNHYNRIFGDTVTVWCMPIPTSAAFYTPDDAGDSPAATHRFIKNMFDDLDPGVRSIDLFPVLAAHAAEPIYSRTDHHWAPLGAYYAARAFATLADVPFADLSDYERHVIPGYVGTMAKFAGDASIKRAPEDFVYYTPLNTDVETTYITYHLDRRRRHVISETEPEKGKFFLNFKGVSSYCTFMGGDQKLTKVVTPVKNGRRLVILKDSFGNAIAGYLFNSFEEIHVIDCRYFTKNMKDYIRDNRITDILFANNVGHAASARTYEMYEHYLDQ